MKIIYCINCNKYRKVNPKILCIFDKALARSVICDKCDYNVTIKMKRYLKKKNQLRY